MTTMTMARARVGLEWQPRWGSVVHGSVLLALLSGVAALWITLALLAALLAAPVTTVETLERDGAWGMVDVTRQGSTVVLSMVRTGAVQGRTR